MKKKMAVSMALASALMAISITASAAPQATSEKVPGASAQSVVEVSSVDAKVAKTISIYAKITTSHNAVYYDFYGEPNNDFSAEWLKLINGKYVSQQTWHDRLNKDGWYPGSWGQGAGTSWKLILTDKDNGSSATYTYTIGN